MKMKRVIAIICMACMFVESTPMSVVQAVSNKIDVVQNVDTKKLEINKDASENSSENILEEQVNLESNNAKDLDLTKLKEQDSNELENVVEEKNKTAVIHGADDIRIYKDENFDFKEGITAVDADGKDISDLITVEGTVDSSKIGNYILTYSVKDNKNVIASVSRNIKVIEKNEFNVFNKIIDENTKEEKKEQLFSISFDNKTSKFTVYNQSLNELDPSKKNETVFKIRVLDKDNNEKLLINLLGKDTGNSEKLETLKQLKYSYGDYIEIDPLSYMKDGFEITGQILGDITKDKENYSDGVDNIDYIANVRFRISEDGIESVYNKAPEINGLTPMEKLFKNRKSQLEGVTVIDDHDKEISNDNIKISEEKDDKNNIIGFRYEVTDSWGRTVSAVRYLKSKIEDSEESKSEDVGTVNYNMETYSDNYIRTATLSSNVIVVKGFTYNNGNDVRFKIKFNGDTNKIELYDRDSRWFDNKMTDTYFKMILYSKKGTVKKELIINGSDRADAKKIDELNNLSFEFGDQIELYHAYSNDKLLIEGTVTDKNNNTLNFNQGVPKERLVSSRFELTRNGLKYLVNTPPRIEFNEENLVVVKGSSKEYLLDINIIDDIDTNIKKSDVKISSYYPNRLGEQTIVYTVQDSWGAVAEYRRTITVVSDSKLGQTAIKIKNAQGDQDVFSIGFNDVDRKLLIQNKSDVSLDEVNPDELALTIKIISKAGVTKKEINLNGNASGNSNKLEMLDGYRYNIDDYIEIWSPNYRNSIRIDGEISQDSEITENYSEGIEDERFFKYVRFKVGSAFLSAKYNKAPTFKFKKEMVRKRGDSFDPLSYIEKIDDDYDNLNNNLVKVSYDKSKINTVGTFDITYRITDGWGRTTQETKTITVSEKNDLEKIKIKLASDDGDNSTSLISLSFDDVEKRLLADVNENKYISGSENDTAFEVSIFTSEGDLKAKSTVRYNESIDEALLQDIIGIDIDYGDRISFYAYSNEKLSITGSVIGDKNYEFGFESDDVMNHTRFVVTENGLRELYNEAPEFEGVANKSIMKNEEFDPWEDVIVTDDQDGPMTVNSEKVTVSGTVDVTKAGLQTLTYKATDSWGRSKIVERYIYVRPLAENNKIILKNSNNQDAFVLGFDFSRMNFTISTAEGSEEQLSPGDDEEVFSVTVRNPDGKENTVNLLGSDTGNSPKLQKLNDLPLSVGSQLSFWVKDHTKLRILGQIIKSEEIPDYDEEISDPEYINNVRFVGTEDGIQAIHNKAPQLELPEDIEQFVLYKGDNYEEELLKNVQVTDENLFDEGINTESVELKFKRITSNGEESEDSDEVNNSEFINLEEFKNQDRLGEYEVYYVATDSWGRKSDIKKREVTLKTSIDRNSISFPGYNSNIGDYEVFKLKFNSDTMTFKLTDRRNDQIHHGNREFFRIKLFGASGNEKQSVTMQANDTGMSSKLNKLETTQFEYGDYLTIYAYQTGRVKISGPVRNQYENYSDGAQLADDFQYTRFYITEKGLESKFVPEAMEDYESLIEFIGTNGGTPFKMKFNHAEGTITYPNTTEFYNYGNTNRNNAFRVYAKKTDRNREESYTSKGIDSGVHSGLKNLFNGRFNDGDYLRFEYLDIPEDFIGIRISGAIAEENKNYKDKLISHTDIENVRFYLRTSETRQYIDPVYNEGPKFKTIVNGEHIDGLQDKNIYVEDIEDFDAKSDVVVLDDHDNEKPEKQFEVTGPALTGIGQYVYTYTSIDLWGRRTTLQRNIYVRPNVFKNRIQLYSKGINSDGDEDVNQSTKANEEPVFEIFFDNVRNKYSVKNRKNVAINPEIGEKTAVTIKIYDSLRNVRETIELKGSDTGLSETLDRLNNVTFQDGDTIRLSAIDAKSVRIAGDINKDIQVDTQSKIEEFNNLNYADGTDNEDYLNNVAFKVQHSGITAYYNGEPEINIEGLTSNNELNIFYGEDINLRRNIVVEDDRDTLLLDNITIIDEELVDTNKIDSYKVIYVISDTWGRVTRKEVTVNVVSNMENNYIEVYGESSSIEGVKEHKFTLKFNTKTKKIESHRENNVQGNSANTSNPITENLEQESEKYFQIVVTNRNGTEKANVILSRTQMDSDEYLTKLLNIDFFNEDIISLYSIEKENVRIKGKVINESGKSFSEGFESVEQFANVKFKITNAGFELLEYKQLILEFSEDLVINRGNSKELFEGVKLRYADNSKVDLSSVKVDIRGVDEFKTGEYTATYTITDVWGKTIENTRNVTVIERNPLEHNRIVLKDSNTGKKLMEFYIDTIEQRIVTRRYNNEYTGDEEGTLIKLTLYGENAVTKGSIEVTRNNLNTIEEKFIEYDYTDLIGISVYDIKDGLSIQGNIEDSNESYLNGVNNADNINHVRFQILDMDNGVKSIFNNAPVINFEKDPLVAYKDEIPSLLDGVSVEDTDQHDKDVSVTDMFVETELDITMIGDYTATYIVQDTWGRETRKDRRIIVQSSLLNNRIEFYRENDENNILFDISFDVSENEFIVNKDRNVLRKIRNKAKNTDVSNEGIQDINRPNEEIEFEFKLYNKDGKVKSSMSITSSDMTSRNGIESKLDNFNKTQFAYGDYISIYAKESVNNFRITGNIDIPNNIPISYKNGVEDPNYMYNVRFRINEDSMYAVYNEKPKFLISDPDRVIDVYCGDELIYGDDIEISDDHDIDIGTDNITLSEEDKQKIKEIGECQVDLILTDSWGRRVSVKRKYNIKSSISRNVIRFPGRQGGVDGEVFKVGFDAEQQTIRVFDKNPITIQQHNGLLFFKINVYDSNDERKIPEIQLISNDRGDTSKLSNLENLHFDYGDYITIYAFQTGRVKIDGPVRNQLEDYSDGVQFGDDLQFTRFYITKEGLKSEFVPEKLNSNESLIEFVGTNGGIPFKMKFNHEDNTISYPKTTEYYYYDAPNNKEVFRVKYYNSETGEVRSYESRGKDGEVNANLKRDLNGSFNDGDYISFEYIDIPDKLYGLRLTGQVTVKDEDDKELIEEDYSDGIQNKRNLEEVRFYLNKDGEKGIFPVRIPAATITGAGDIDVLQGEIFNLKTGVKAMDADGVTELTSSIRITGDNNLTRNIDGNWNLDTSRIGLYYVKYEVDNSEGITTTVYRNIRVYTNASLALRDEGVDIVMEQGAYKTAEEQIEYLKSYVIAQDTETTPATDISERIEVDVSNINIEEPGEYPIKYSVINDYGKESVLETYVSVVRTISVTVPKELPFQVVTNLIDKTQDPFISGILKLQNNKTSDVKVFLKSFNKLEQSGNLDIVGPEEYNWDTLSEQESMSKMALGLFTKSGFTPLEDETLTDKENPVWLSNNMTTKTPLGIIERAPSLSEYSEAGLSFTSRHGNEFIGGRTKGKFEIVFEFE